MLKIEFILFDAIGTLIAENSEKSVVIDSFIIAFKHFGIEVTYEQVNYYRGFSKKDVVRQLLKINQNKEVSDDEIYTFFISLLQTQSACFVEFDGSTDVLTTLKKKGIKIGIGSGLPKEILMNLCKNLGWEQLFDYYGSSEEIGKSRPDPVMIFDAMKKLNIRNVRHVLKVGDTVADIREGKNAGAVTVLVLTGTQELRELEKENPDYILREIRYLPSLLINDNQLPT